MRTGELNGDQHNFLKVPVAYMYCVFIVFSEHYFGWIIPLFHPADGQVVRDYGASTTTGGEDKLGKCEGYRIAGNLCKCKFSYKWPQDLQKKFSYFFSSYVLCARALPRPLNVSTLVKFII